MNVKNQIIDKIKRNRISTTEIADCLNKTGDVANVYALNRGHFRVGEVFWAYAYNQSNWEVHEQLRFAPENSVIIVETFECENRAVFGQLVSKYLLLYKQVSAIVVQGKLRDVPHLIKENWPIWYQGATPIGCFNKQNNPSLDEKIINQRRLFYNNAIGVCDDSGVVVIPESVQNDDFLNKLDWIEEQEDIWFDCVDRLKWDTYKTVCLKDYIKEEQ